jgi:hypothetical protein
MFSFCAEFHINAKIVRMKKKKKKKEKGIFCCTFPDFPPNKMSIFEKQKLKILATFSPLDFRGEAVFLTIFLHSGQILHTCHHLVLKLLSGCLHLMQHQKIGKKKLKIKKTHICKVLTKATEDLNVKLFYPSIVHKGSFNTYLLNN